MIDNELSDFFKNVKDNGINVEFELEGLKLWFNKKGIIKKKLAAMQFLQLNSGDLDFLMSDKREKSIEYLTSGLNLDKGDDVIDIGGVKYWDFIESLPEVKDGQPYQAVIDASLPQVVAAVIMGESVIMAYMTSAGSPELQEKKPAKQTQESIKNLKKPVRKLPKAAA